MKKRMSRETLIKLADGNFHSVSDKEIINFAKKLGIDVLEKPLEFDVECEWYANNCIHCGFIGIYPTLTNSVILKSFVGKKTKVKITEILE